MAKLSAKQIRFFGTKRQRAALKAKRRRPAAKHATRSNPRRRPGTISKRDLDRMKRGLLPSSAVVPKYQRHKKKTNSSRSRRKAPIRKNPELVSFLLGNPAKRSSKKVARSKKKTVRAASSKAGTRRSRRKTVSVGRRHRRRQSNPGMGTIGNPKTWLMGGAGALAGFVGSAALPQMVLGAGNSGIAGYAATAAAAVGLGLLSHFLLPRNTAVTVGVVSGGFANLLRRVISDQTPFGAYVSGAGMGDYMVSNWGPPRMQDGLHSAIAEPAGTPWGGGMITASSGVSSQDMADMRSSRPC